MFDRRRPRGAAAVVASASIAVVVGIALAASGSTVAIAAPSAESGHSDYPSWGDVQAAKANQAATQAEVTKLQGLVTQLQAQSDALGKAASIADEQANQARDALAAATSKTQTLQSQADAAKVKADKSAKRASALIAQLARTGGGNISMGMLFGSAKSTDQLLSSLGTANRLSASSAEILKQATFDKNTASSAAAAAIVAQKKRDSLATAAATADAAAQKASDDAQAQLAQQQAATQTMFAQLASLKNTTSDVEAQYAAGAAEQAQQKAAAAAATKAAAASASAPVLNPNPGQPVAGAVAGAIGYAEAQLGKPYRINGAGPTYWDCSGLTLMSYRSAGVYIGTHSATNQYDTLRAAGKLVNLSQLAPGDLLFYTDGGGDMYHVAMAVGGGRMIEAPRDGVPVRIVAIRSLDLMPYAGRPTG